MEPTLFMLIGIPASGKSTWRAKQKDAVVISTDDKIDAYANASGKTYSEIFAEKIAVATRDMEQDLKLAIANNENIIWDQTNLTAASRAKKLRKIPKNYHKIAVYFPVPKDLDERLASRPGKTIPTHIIEQMKLQLEEPTFEEGWNQIIKVYK